MKIVMDRDLARGKGVHPGLQQAANNSFKVLEDDFIARDLGWEDLEDDEIQKYVRGSIESYFIYYLEYEGEDTAFSLNSKL